MKKILAFLGATFFVVTLHALTYDSGGGAAGADQGDSLSGSTANAVMYTNGSNAITTGSGLTFNGTTFSAPTGATFATTSGSVGISTGSPTFALDVNGTVRLSSNSVVDAIFLAGQAVTSGSTNTLTWTEITDRLGEFVTSSFTVVLAGLYELSVQAGASQTAGTGCLLVQKNGVTIAGAESCATGATALLTVLNPQLTRIFNLAANDIIQVRGSATSANVTFQKGTLSIKRVN